MIHPLFFGIFGMWMTFIKTEMKKILRNALSFSEMDFLNHRGLYFVICLGLALHQFKKKPAVNYIFIVTYTEGL